ncbi:hypothetical protein A3J32_01490 [Candidatus Saccharibacteria bacterium RIFCSPLOWO2_02_FULL_46_7]|nr:MAG: hypothetical protein A3J32_01490 [Candidatus Saccharibacteria bacterium RIFCSPLOWO2_02_FULL_46_7]
MFQAVGVKIIKLSGRMLNITTCLSGGKQFLLKIYANVKKAGGISDAPMSVARPKTRASEELEDIFVKKFASNHTKPLAKNALNAWLLFFLGLLKKTPRQSKNKMSPLVANKMFATINSYAHNSLTGTGLARRI